VALGEFFLDWRHYPDLARIEAALKRVTQKARKTAKDTGTPLVI